LRAVKIAAATLLALVFAALVAGIITVVVAGVTLEVRNHSRSVIQDLAIDYERGRIDVARLGPGQEWSERVGKIGEGATFLMTFRDGDRKYAAQFDVYFYGLGPRTTVVFEILSDQRVQVWEEGQRSSQNNRAERAK
jgi:hypothetical protein